MPSMLPSSLEKTGGGGTEKFALFTPKFKMYILLEEKCLSEVVRSGSTLIIFYVSKL